MNTAKSEALLARAEQLIPGGVNSPVRAFKSVGGTPRFIAKGEGVFLEDVDGNRYIDFVSSWGPLILGHAPRVVLDEIRVALPNGTSFGAPTEAEVELADLVVKGVPSVEMVRFVNSGTEATMSAIRLARGITGRDFIIKCNGCYHGHADCLLAAAGSGVATLGIPGSPGIPQNVVEQTLVVEFNDLAATEAAIERVGGSKIAALIIEPVAGNMGLVLPKKGYLAGLRELCNQHGILLIFDEVMSGFRVALGGAQERFSVMPDITTLGKVIGGGLPVGAFGGSKEVMQRLAPAGDVYQAGTLSGNPLAVAGGRAMLRWLLEHNPYPELEERGRQFQEGMQQAANQAGVPFTAVACGSMVGFFFSSAPVTNYLEAKRADAELFKRFLHGMLERGVYLAPSAFEAGFLGMQHTTEIIEQTVAHAKEVFTSLA